MGLKKINHIAVDRARLIYIPEKKIIFFCAPALSCPNPPPQNMIRRFIQKAFYSKGATRFLTVGKLQSANLVTHFFFWCEQNL